MSKGESPVQRLSTNLRLKADGVEKVMDGPKHYWTCLRGVLSWNVAAGKIF
jgi:hypothetical protein